MLFSDTREGGVVPRSAAKVEADEVMELGMLNSVWQREDLLCVRSVDRAPVIRLSGIIASNLWMTATRITISVLCSRKTWPAWTI